MPEDNQYSAKYNKTLKGRYAYWVKMEYIVPLEEIDYQQYISLERVLDTLDYIKSDDLYDYIDLEETDRINNISEFVLRNNTVTDALITLQEIKKFRTWLAESLLSLKDNYDEATKHMLEYYKNGLYDDTIKYLDMFGGIDINISYTGSSCGCCEDKEIYDINTLTNCDTINIYRNDIEQYMISIFSDYKFWEQYSIDFLKTFKLYIDNIIKVGLPLTKIHNNIYIDCVCLDNVDSNYSIILLNLSKSLEYIINNDINGHRNFINDSLKKWSNIYPIMEWK